MFSTNCSEEERNFKHITEVYLFVNPIGSTCYKTEKEILRFVDSFNQKVHLHFIPFHNFSTVSSYMKANKLPERNLTLRNKLYSQMYEACLANAAATMQGKKKGRTFLMAMQKAITEDYRIFSSELLIECAKKAKLDIDIFVEDKDSDLAKSAFDADQKVAREMNVLANPSCVLFNHHSKDYGLLIEDCITVELLQKLCRQDAGIHEPPKKRIDYNNAFTGLPEHKLHIL